MSEGITVNEPLNPSAWTVEQQQDMYNRLAELLQIPGCEYTNMTDEELSASLQDLCAEMKTRPATSVELQESIQFYNDTIIAPVVD